MSIFPKRPFFSKKKDRKFRTYKIFNLEIRVPRSPRSVYFHIFKIFGIEFRYPKTAKYQKLCMNTPIVSNKVVFSNFLGNSYGCNPKYITEQLLKEELPLDLVWLVKNPSQEAFNFPRDVRLVKFDSKEAFQELASAKVWVDNCRKNKQMSQGLIKKEGQHYIQTWHGSFGIKRLDADVEQFLQDPAWVERSQKDASAMDYFISNSTFEKEVVAKALWFQNEVKEFGHPRNDIFFGDTSVIKEKLKNYYGIDANKKLLLYAPSFRDNGDLNWFVINYKSVLVALSERFGDEWVFVLRFHPRVKLPVPEQNNMNFVNASNYPDIQELLAGCDVAISDYSSCMYDFILSRNPGFIFAPDLEKYNNMRGLYYPLESTPFPVAKTNEELVENIKNFDMSLYKDKCESFLEEKGCYEDGHASERVVDLIKSLVNPEIR